MKKSRRKIDAALKIALEALRQQHSRIVVAGLAVESENLNKVLGTRIQLRLRRDYYRGREPHSHKLPSRPLNRKVGDPCEGNDATGANESESQSLSRANRIWRDRLQKTQLKRPERIMQQIERKGDDAQKVKQPHLHNSCG